MALSLDEKQKINPGIAAVLSFVFSGLGQIYNGQIMKGLCIMSFSTLGIILSVIGFILLSYCFIYRLFANGDMLLGGILLILGFFIITSLGVYNVFDAYNTAKKKLEG